MKRKVKGKRYGSIHAPKKAKKINISLLAAADQKYSKVSQENAAWENYTLEQSRLISRENLKLKERVRALESEMAKVLIEDRFLRAGLLRHRKRKYGRTLPNV